MLVGDLPSHGLARHRVGDVKAQSAAADRRGHGHSRVEVDVGGDDVVPTARELARDGRADAAAGARHDRDRISHFVSLLGREPTAWSRQ